MSFVSRNALRLVTCASLVATMLLIAAAPAAAHVTIPDGSSIPAGSTTIVHVRVPHGCAGASTDRIEVQLPEGIVAAQPAYVPGWDVEVEMVDAAPYERFGETFTERVGVVRWSGGSLPDHAFFDFGIRATFLLEAGQELAIPILQGCGDVEEAWIGIPLEGQDPDELEYPAPVIRIVEPPPAVTEA